ncbi:MAG: hypothetical protein ACYC61_22860 [Isosphaeraceae bacterium]
MPRQVSVPSSISVQGMRVSGIELKPNEDKDEKALRLHKERLTFYFKDIGTYVFGFIFLAAIAVYCFWVLLDKSTSAEERRYAWAAISAVMGGIVGVVFGRSTK